MAESTVLIKIVTRGERKAEKLRETLDRTKTVTRQLDGQLKRTFGGTATKQLDRATRGLDKFDKEAKTANRTLQALAATAAGLSALNIGISGTGLAGFGQALKLGVVSSKRLVSEQKKLEPIQDKLARQQEKFQSNLEQIAELERIRPFAVGQTSKNIKQSAKSLAEAKAKVTAIDQELKKLKASNRGLKPEIDKNTAAYNRQEAVVNRISKRLRIQKGLLKGLQGTLNRLSKVGPGGILAGLGVGAGGAAAFNAASNAESLQARLKIVSKEYTRLDGLQERAAESAKRLRVTNSEALASYIDLANRLGDQGRSAEDLQKVYEGLNVVLIKNKVSSQEAASATLQLNQALGANKLQGEEFRAINEAAPQVISAIAKELNIARGEVKQFAADGLVTGDVVIRALERIRTEGLGDLEAQFTGAFGATRNFNVALKEFAEIVGAELLPVITPLIKGATELLKVLSKLPPDVKKVAVGFALFGAAALIAIPLVGKLLSGIGLLATAFGVGKLAVVAFGAKVALFTGLVTLAVAPTIKAFQAQAEWNRVLTEAPLDEVNKKIDELRDKINKAENKTVTWYEALIDFTFGMDGASTSTAGFIKQLDQLLARQAQLQGFIDAAKELRQFYAGLEAGGKKFKNFDTLTPAQIQEALQLAGIGGNSSNSGSAGSAPQNDTQQAQDLLRTLNQQLELTRAKQGLESELLRIEQQRRDTLLEINRLQGVSPELVAQLQGATNALAEAEKEKAVREVIKGFINDALQKEKERIEVEKDVFKTLTGERELLEAKLNRTEKEYLIQKQIDELVERMGGKRREEVEALVRGNEALKERVQIQEDLDALFDSIGSSIENGIIDSITAGLEALTGGVEDLDEALQKIASDTLKQIGQALISYGLSNIGGPGKGIGDLFAGLFKAEGGPVTGGQPYIVGERGPEMFLPSSSGTVINSRDTMAALSRYSPGNARSIEELAMSGGGSSKSDWAYEPVINVSTGNTLVFEGRNYVTQADFQAGISEAAIEGAKAGEARTLRRLRMSPGTRSKLGF